MAYFLIKIKYNKFDKEIDQENEILFNKLIKTELFKKIINEYKFINYTNCIYNYYDNILLFSLMNHTVRFEHMNINGIIKNVKDINELKLTNIMNNKDQKIKDSIFYINFLFGYSNNTIEGKKYALNEYYNILSIIYNKFNNITNDSIKLLTKFNESKLINNNDKRYLYFYYKSLIN